MKVGLIGSDYINEDISNRLIASDIEVWGYQNDYSKSEEQYEKGSLSGCVTSLEYLSDVSIIDSIIIKNGLRISIG